MFFERMSFNFNTLIRRNREICLDMSLSIQALLLSTPLLVKQVNLIQILGRYISSIIILVVASDGFAYAVFIITHSGERDEDKFLIRLRDRTIKLPFL